MTVCVACLFNWHSDQPGEWRPAVVTASDQMITAGDIQYEPLQQKVSVITQKILILVAGEFPTHSEAIQGTMRAVGNKKEVTPHQVAVIYGQQIQAIRRRSAEDQILAPLGLNMESFLAQQQEMSDHIVTALTEQLLTFGGHEVDAMVGRPASTPSKTKKD